MTTTARPELKDEYFADVPEEFRDDIRQSVIEALDTLEERGPVTLHFTDRDSGKVVMYDYTTMENVEHPMTGDLEVGTYCELNGALFHDPDPKVFDTLDLSHFMMTEMEAATDDTLRALLTATGLTEVNVDAYVRDPETGEPLNPDAAPLSDSAVAEIAQHPSVRSVRVSGSAASAETLAAIVTKLPDLRVIALDSTQARYEDLSFFAESELDVIQLASPHLTGEALNTLPTLPSVTAALFNGDQILTTVDATKFKEALPNLEYIAIANADGSEVELKDTLQLRALYPEVEINNVHYAPKAVARLATKHGIDLP